MFPVLKACIRHRALPWIEIAVFAAVLALVFFARRYFLPELSPIDGGYQSFAMLWPLELRALPGIDFVPYLGVGMSYVLTPLHMLFGSSFFSALAAAELMTLTAMFALVTVTCVLFGLGVRAFTMVAFGIVLWAVALSELVYGFRGMEFLVAGNSLLLLREALPWLIVLVLAVRAARVRRRTVPADGPPGPLALPLMLAPALAAGAPFWSNASGIATCLALLMVWGLAVIVTPAAAGARLRAFLRGGVLFAVTLGVTLLIITGGAPMFYLEQNFLGIADYQFWYFPPYLSDRRVFGLGDLVTALVFPFGWASVLGWGGAVLAIAGNWWRFGLADLRSLGVIFILLAHLGGGAISQIGGHVNPRYMLVFQSVALLFGLVQLARLVLPPLVARLRLPEGLLFGVGRLGALAGVLALTAAVFVQSYREFTSVPRVFFAPLGLHVEESYARELTALQALRDLPEIADRPPAARIFSGYLSAAELMLNARPATRFGSAIHVLGDGARATYLAGLSGVDYPLIALTSPVGPMGYWHDWHLRANWYLYAPILAGYDPAFRTRYMMFLTPRTAPVAVPADLPALRCEIRATGPGTTEVTIADDSRAGDAHFGADWLIDVTLAQTSTMAPRRFPENLLPLVGTRGLIAVSDRSSGHMARDPAARPAPPPLLGPDGGFLGGLPLGSGDRRIPAEHRFGTPSHIVLTALPETRGALEVRSCTLTPVRPNPFADAETAFPRVSDIDAAARLSR